MISRRASCALTATLLVALSSCSTDAPEPATSGTTAGSSAPRTSTGDAMAGDVVAGDVVAGQGVADHTPAPVTVLGERGGETQSGGSFTIRLNAVRRITDEIGVVSATLVAESTLVSVSTFREPGQDLGDDLSFSGVSLTTAGDDTLYQSVRDVDGVCVCSRVTNLPAGGTEGLFSYVSLPAGASTVDLTIQGVETFTGVPVS